MVKIRLARFGKKKTPTYRVVISDAQKDTQGTYIESIGTYNPSVNPKVISIDSERVSYWLSVGAQPSPTVHNLLVSQGLLKDSKIRAAKYKKPEVTEAAASPEAAGTEKTEEAKEDAKSDDEPEKAESNEEQPVAEKTE